ncbi:MAG TPA: lanthionine synthetase LanC family protein [Polyangia bacterium]
MTGRQESARERSLPSPLSPQDRERAQAIVGEIARTLVRLPPPLDGDPDLATSLMSREPGCSLFYAYLHRVEPRAAWHRQGVRHLERAIARVPNQSRKPFFSYGFSGTAWALEHLDGWFIDVPADMNRDVDGALLTLVDEAPTLSFDLHYGLVGFGIYAVERLPARAARRLLERILARLERMAEPHAGGLRWRVVNAEWVEGEGVAAALARGVYLHGLLNGVAGVVGVCGAAIHHGVDVRRARRLLEGALTWMWKTREDGLFPARAQMSLLEGSLGVAAVARVAARAARLPTWEARALAILRRLAALRGAAARTPAASIGAGLAGAAYVFHRASVETGEPLLGAAARHFAHLLIRRRRPGRGLCGYSVWSPYWQRRYLGDPDYPVGWIGVPGFSDGVAGIGLVLLQLLRGGSSDWDRAFLLSYR